MKNKRLKIILLSVSCILIISIVGYLLGAAFAMDLNIKNWSEENRGGFISFLGILVIFPLVIWLFKTILDLCE